MAKKVLITYYSWSGITKRLAQEIAEEIPFNTSFEIKVPQDTFSDDMYQTFDIAKKQIADNDYPKINIPNINPNDYDLIIVGSPVWGGMPATPIHTFLQQIQGFNGDLASFYTDAGTVGNYENTFKKWANGMNVVKVFNQVAEVGSLLRK